MGTHSDRLEALKAARISGNRSKTYKSKADVDLYDELDEADYKKVVASRQARDDFIDDDDGTGYIDNGEEDWDRSDGMELDSEEERKQAKLRKAKKQANQKQRPAKVRAPLRDIAKPENGEVDESSAHLNPYRKQVAPAVEDDFMKSLLSGLKQEARPSALVRKSSLGKRKVFETPDFIPSSDDTAAPSSDPFPKLPSSPTKRSRLANRSSDNELANVTSKHLKAQSSSESEDDFDVVKPRQILNEPSIRVNAASSKPQAAVKKEEDEEMMTPKAKTSEAPAQSKQMAWMAISSKLKGASGSGLEKDEEDDKSQLHTDIVMQPEEIPIGHSPVHEDDESIRLFWTEHHEAKGAVTFFGKVMDRSRGKWATASLTVRGIQRNIFLLPRDTMLDDEGQSTQETPSPAEIIEEFEEIARRLKIKNYDGKFVQRNYAFEEKGMPHGENEYYKVNYPFERMRPDLTKFEMIANPLKEPAIPTDLTGNTFSRMSGQNISAFENLVLKRKIKGPCWLNVSRAAVVPRTSQITHMRNQFEFCIDDPKSLNVFSDKDPMAPAEMPPLTVMSLAVRAVVPVDNSNERELLCVSARIWQNMSIDGAKTPDQLPSVVRTFVRPLFKAFPKGFDERLRSEKAQFDLVTDEKKLLQQVLALFPRYDPDIVLGHGLISDSLDTVLSRLAHFKVPGLSQTGRLKFERRPAIRGDTRNIFRSRIAPITAGRILCDLSGDDIKKNFMTQFTTWSLTEMCEVSLKIQREDIDPDLTSSFFDAIASPDRTLMFIKHCEVDTYFQMAVASNVQLLALTRQLTNLAGNSWNETLNAGAIARNEYILLHEFHRQKYICPNPSKGKSQITREIEDEDEKGSYKGGLVFEPKRGLWDKLILVMDFNSLYPSIIQEYNIDFTTIDRSKSSADDDNEETQDDNADTDEKKLSNIMPNLPGPEVKQGVLPALISTLVNRRRLVKSLMKDKTASASQISQWNIKQLALKLTANSMYGCLGRKGTRFASRSLAALTTFKGREILTHTKELAESLQLEVVYGDTDSVFLNSNVLTYPEAMQVANEFKKLVNDRYKLLEIDLDGVFARLLLLQKKKYAALTLSEDGRTATEIKGLDMKRREYSNLSKKASMFVLDQILSGVATETAIQKIHDFLIVLGNEVRDGTIPLEDFIINKQLGRDPKSYPDGKSQPHVVVALRMKNVVAKAKDVIPYVFCVGPEGKASTKAAKAENAYHPDDLRRSDSNLKIDYDYYISLQILPPVVRLCENIEGTDRAHLAECLGLNPAHYATTNSSSNAERQFSTLDSLTSDSERFRESTSFSVICHACNQSNTIGGLPDNSSGILTASGFVCQNCQVNLNEGSVITQLEMQTRDHITRFYDGVLQCDDASCAQPTRHIGVYGKRCLAKGCRGTLHPQYSDIALYNQLLFFSTLFDRDRALKNPHGEAKNSLQTIIRHNTPMLDRLHGITKKHLERNGRAVVCLSEIFKNL